MRMGHDVWQAFQFGNVYVVTEKLQELYSNEELLNSCLKFIRAGELSFMNTYAF